MSLVDVEEENEEGQTRCTCCFVTRLAFFGGIVRAIWCSNRVSYHPKSGTRARRGVLTALLRVLGLRLLLRRGFRLVDVRRGLRLERLGHLRGARRGGEECEGVFDERRRGGRRRGAGATGLGRVWETI